MTAVSIITPVYNCEKYIKESLDSICDQIGFNDFEWLILNDGSTDSTWDIICNHPFPCIDREKIILIDDKENIKIPRRRNIAVSFASGKYIAIHDGDDVSLPFRLKDQFDFLESNTDIFCVGGHALKMDLEGEPLGEMDYPKSSHAQIVGQFYRCVNPMVDPTTMFRRKDFLELGGYSVRDDIYTVPDMDLWCKAILCGKKLSNIIKPLIKYRTNPSGMTVKHKEEMIEAHMIVWREFKTQLIDQSFRRRYGSQMDYRRTEFFVRKQASERKLGIDSKIPKQDL